MLFRANFTTFLFKTISLNIEAHASSTGFGKHLQYLLCVFANEKAVLQLKLNGWFATIATAQIKIHFNMHTRISDDSIEIKRDEPGPVRVMQRKKKPFLHIIFF